MLRDCNALRDPWGPDEYEGYLQMLAYQENGVGHQQAVRLLNEHYAWLRSNREDCKWQYAIRRRTK
jgi:hypothetical protein